MEPFEVPSAQRPFCRSCCSPGEHLCLHHQAAECRPVVPAVSSLQFSTRTMCCQPDMDEAMPQASLTTHGPVAAAAVRWLSRHCRHGRWLRCTTIMIGASRLCCESTASRADLTTNLTVKHHRACLFSQQQKERPAITRDRPNSIASGLSALDYRRPATDIPLTQSTNAVRVGAEWPLKRALLWVSKLWRPGR